LPGQPGTFSVELDDISVVAAPEPASSLALGGVFLPLLWRRRSR
jgi:MYXO-CTERM domain-containing protein